MSKMQLARVALGGLGAIALTVLIAQPAQANIVYGGSLGCPPDTTVRIAWTTTGSTGSYAYYNTAAGWITGNVQYDYSSDWDTGRRSVTEWRVISNDHVGSAYAYCG